MSYYYGINFTWGLYGGLCTTNNKAQVVNYKSATFLNTVDVSTTERVKNNISLPPTYEVSYKDDTPWIIPDDFPITYPHEPMCRIQFTVPDSYVTDTDNAFKSSIIMTNEDQYYIDNIYAHFHRHSKTEYFAYRYQDNGKSYTEIKIKLPSVSEMNINPA